MPLASTKRSADWITRGRFRRACRPCARAPAGTSAPVSFGSIGVGNIEDAHAGILLGGEDQRVGLEAAGPVLMQIMRAEMAALGGIVGFGRRRQRCDRDRVRRLAMSKIQVRLRPSSSWSSTASSATISRSRAGSGSGECVPPPKGGDQLRCVISFGADLSAMSRIVSPPSRQQA